MSKDFRSRIEKLISDVECLRCQVQNNNSGGGGGTSTNTYITGATLNASTGILTLTDNNGSTSDVTVNLSPLKDGNTFITGAALNASTGVLTLSDNSGSTADITVDLSALRSKRFKVDQAFASFTDTVITHNLGYDEISVEAYTSAGVRIEPHEVKSRTTTQVTLQMGVAGTFTIIVK
jgi:hypothetical protein